MPPPPNPNPRIVGIGTERAWIAWRNGDGSKKGHVDGLNIFNCLGDAVRLGATQADGMTSNGTTVSFVLRDGIWRRRTNEHPEGQPTRLRYR